MNPHLKRTLLFISGFVMAMGSSISSMDGGATLTVSQMSSIPLVAYLFAIGAGISGVLGVAKPQK